MQHGLQDVTIESTELPSAVLSSPTRPMKRARELIEIEDSDAEDVGSDEEFGWDDDDEMAAENLVEHTSNAADT